MARKFSNGTAYNAESVASDSLGTASVPTTPVDTESAVQPETSNLDLTQLPQGLRLIGTIVARSSREFPTFVKVFYDVQCGKETFVMAEMHSRPLEPVNCLAIGEFGAWEVWVHAYLDKQGHPRTQFTRKTDRLPCLPGTKPF